jgi:DNA processing protein
MWVLWEAAKPVPAVFRLPLNWRPDWLRGVLAWSVGLALGIDTAAHQGALAASGRTVAVLGCGADYIYPAANRGLYRRIIEAGAVVSEFPMGAAPEPGWFPRRNRLISGLSLGVILVEAGQRSGALITATCALEQNREVFAVPGEVLNGKSAGCHRLIQDGAKLVESVDDVLEELGPSLGERPSRMPVAEDLLPSTLAADEAALVTYLGDVEKHVDDLAKQAGRPAGEVLGSLLQLELAGVVEQLPGKRFVRSKP